MPCYDDRIDDRRTNDAYAAGLLCELMKVCYYEQNVMTKDLEIRLVKWYGEHSKHEK